MEIPNLTTETIRKNTAGGSYRRGEEYFNTGAVLSVQQAGERQVEAFVKGGDVFPYTVHIQYDDAGITDARCTCPYHAGSWCKHIVAALLAYLHRAKQDEPRSSVAALLDGLDRDALVGLLERLVEREPELADWVKREYAHLR